MTFLETKQHVAAMLSRSVTDFTLNSVDSLARAVNAAVERAQRLVDFEFAKQRGYLPLTNGSANYITAMLDAPEGTSVAVKKLVSVFAEENFVKMIRLRGEREHERLNNSYEPFAYFVGPTLYIHAWENAGAFPGVYTTYLQKLPKLSADGDTNFLLQYCSDWVIIQAMFELQFYMKEDDRIQLSAGLLRDKWDSVVAWNASLQSEQDLSLD